MKNSRSLSRRLSLRSVLFFVLLLSGILPLVLSGGLLLLQNRGLLQNAERDVLIREVGALSRQVEADLTATRRQVTLVGQVLLATPGPEDVLERLGEPWVAPYLSDVTRTSGAQVIGVLDLDGHALLPSLNKERGEAVDTAFRMSLSHRAPTYVFVRGEQREPVAALAVPVPAQAPRLVVVALFAFTPAADLYREEAGKAGAIALIDERGDILWQRGFTPETQRALLASNVLRDFKHRPLDLTTEYIATAGGKPRNYLAQVSSVPESGWGVVVQKPARLAFEMVRKMAWNTLLSTLVLIGVALGVAFFAARRASRPIQTLARRTHEIAEGHFDRRLESEGVGREIGDLAEDFNRMSGQLESFVEQLRAAAQANRDLFIGSLRAFAAAIDAKDPYTRGHSERVATFSRAIASRLGFSDEQIEKVWIGALLHDVGKIGVDDRILKKVGVLTPEEYDQMKLHTVIGSEILSPIEQLKDVLPAVRWHHESWNGRGYPDGLRGDQIPLFARIVAVADTFDAVTTNRPYQQAYDLSFAVDTITKLAGSRFDAKVVTAFLRAYDAGEIHPAELRAADLEDAVQPFELMVARG
ncbi:MAG TPA: HD domain-containing phosphohydrolase [Thermoanaerobaculia bacterium]|jgi:putative nucleotidyltransferase with HDIG domain|nr:HD domain-containing phosphohydrolase [Thermoanaerobaculia bacterium]